jgi:hypothetical protein
MGATGGRTPPSKLTVSLFAVSMIAAIWAVAMMTSFGRVAYLYFFTYSEYYMGVLSLVSLSITIMLGLVATDRLVLSIRQRVLLQSAHRTFGIIAVGALFLHLWTKLMELHIGIIDVFIPFLRPSNTLYVGLGTIAGWVMMVSMWTGIIRAKFIGRGKPWMWRAIHAFSYLMWPIALVHGLSAGRPAAVWVTVSYVVCVLGVLLGLAVRISVSLNRKKDFASSAGSGPSSMKPVGQLVPTSSSVMKMRPGRRAKTDPSGGSISGRGRTSTAALEQWEPAAQPQPAPISPAPAMTGPPPVSAPPYEAGPPPVSAPPYEAGPQPVSAPPYEAGPQPVSAPPYEAEPPHRRRPRRAEPAGYDPSRSRRGPVEDDYDEVPAARSRRTERYEPTERYDEQRPTERYDGRSRAVSRRAIEAGRADSDADFYDVPPPPRSRRRADGFEADRYEPQERPRARRYVEEEPPRRAREIGAGAPARPRRYDDDVDVAPRARRRPVDDRYGDAPQGRDPRYPQDDPPPRRFREPGPDVDRADSGRHSRSEFVDMAPPARGGDWRDQGGYDMDPDDTPTLIDMAYRRARRAEQQEAPTGASRGARRGRSRGNEMADDTYWRQLRGEAQ